jgi:hypothetical protein
MLFLPYLSLLMNIHVLPSIGSDIELPGILRTDRRSIAPQVAHLAQR